MTSHKEQPAVDTGAEKIARQIEKLEKRAAACRQTHNDFMAAEFEEYAASLRSLATHPAEPAGMELETTAEERERLALVADYHITVPLVRDIDRLLRDNACLRARAEKAEAALEQPVSDETWHLGAMNDALFIINKPPRPSNDEVWHDRPDGPTLFLRTHPLSEKDARQIIDAHNATVTRLSTQLRDARARGKGMEEALLDISRVGRRTEQRRVGDAFSSDGYDEIETVSEEAKIADAALSRPEGSAST